MPAARYPRLARLLCSLVVPGWIAAGALFKLADASPRTLPRPVLELAHTLGITDLHAWLALIVAAELSVAILCLTLPRFGRRTAVALLVAFALVLVVELARGARHCGCFGAWSPPPGAMLGIDLALLGLLVYAGDPPQGANRRRVALATLLCAAAFGLSFGRLRAAGATGTGGEPVAARLATGAGPATSGTVTQSAEPSAPRAPRAWFCDDVTRWIGRNWREVDLLRWLPQLDPPLDAGLRHVVFYRRSCGHCEEMFWTHLVRPEIARHVVAVEVPELPDQLRDDAPWPMPQTEVTHATLPLGTDWIMTTPLVITLRDGVVTCAQEGEYRGCLGLD